MEMPLPLKNKELATILDVSKPAVSQRLSKLQKDQELVKSEGQRTIGIPREVVFKILAEQIAGINKRQIWLFSTIVGGSSKTTGCWSTFNAFTRLSSKKNPNIIISCDSQASIDEIALGSIPDPSNQKVLVDYFSGKATIEEIILPLNEQENCWIVSSHINNSLLDRSLAMPAKIKTEGFRLISDIYKMFEGTKPNLFIDTMPAISSCTATIQIGMQLMMDKLGADEVNACMAVPLRSDRTSLAGAIIATTEFQQLMDTFGLNQTIKTLVYLANFDKRMSISSEILKALFSNENLSPYVADTVIRTSSEVAKSAYKGQSVFSKLSPISEDYLDLTLELLGHQKVAGNS